MAQVPIAGVARVLHHPHRNEAAIGVDCHVRGERAAVAERAAIRRPAEAVTFLDRFAGLLARHPLHRCFGDVAFAVEFAAVEDHLAESCDIFPRRKQSPRRHRRAFAIRQRVSDLADRRHSQIRLVCVRFVRLRQSGNLLGVRPKRRARGI